MSTIGLDIGGANLKLAHSDGQAISLSFPLWKTPQLLASTLASLLDQLPSTNHLAVTMTGELADCFSTKQFGVAEILASVAQIAGSRPIHVWSTVGKFLTLAEARAEYMSVAAANWHALARWWGRHDKVSCGLLIDIGSTTTDIIPVCEQHPRTNGLTDVTRLLSGELLYTGATRTPLSAIVSEVPFHNHLVPVAAEWFSTSLDVALLLEEIPEQSGETATANGGPATRDAAWDRIARQICCDRTECSLDEAMQIARHIRTAQLDQIRKALYRVSEHHSLRSVEQILISGSGRHLARRLLPELDFAKSARVTDLGDVLSPDLASAACAYAVAKLREWE